jgi:hypothetical protein
VVVVVVVVVASLLLVAVSNAACPGGWLNAAVRFLGIRAQGMVGLRLLCCSFRTVPVRC